MSAFSPNAGKHGPQELRIRTRFTQWYLKVLSCKLHNKKYMITSTQIRNTDIYAFIAVVIFKLSGRNVQKLLKTVISAFSVCMSVSLMKGLK